MSEKDLLKKDFHKNEENEELEESKLEINVETEELEDNEELEIKVDKQKNDSINVSLSKNKKENKEEDDKKEKFESNKNKNGEKVINNLLRSMSIIDEELYSIKKNSFLEKSKNFGKDNFLKGFFYYSIKRIIVQSVSKVKDGYITINGEIDIPFKNKDISDYVKEVENVIFNDYSEAMKFASELTSIELEELNNVLDQLNDIKNMYEDNIKYEKF